MKETMAQILYLWGIENRQVKQIYPSAWEINQSYVVKRYDNKNQLERNIKISEMLSDYGIPVAEAVLTKDGEKYVEHQNAYFFLSEKLQGSNAADRKDKETARKMGCAMAQLHKAFLQCEKEMEFWDNSLLKEMKGWVREILANDDWKIIEKESYDKTVEMLEDAYDSLPKQLIHRDVHFGNFLFFEGDLSGYIDFDLSQRNIRIFDICYFLTGLLAEETDEAFTKDEWIEIVKAVISGYESVMSLSADEKNAIPCVMECIEILFVAYFIGLKDMEHADGGYRVYRFIQNCESEIKDSI